MKAILTALSVLLTGSSCHSASVPSLFTVIPDDRVTVHAFPVCQQKSVLSCQLIVVNQDLINSTTDQIALPDGRVLNRGAEIDVNEKAYGIRYSVSTTPTSRSLFNKLDIHLRLPSPP